ncbi:hypothetical protein [Glycomyces arizonensis]|uniref:hypothetical protein n=1 Tax=Glycomyces arizonensis TaxID=256035 RepID=UPI00047E8A8E|nr:hypothetical protein [Glycomyces arizonensis]
MTDTSPRERSLASACGNVTVTITDSPTPTVELAKDAIRMYTRDLAELVTTTARKAADDARADDPDPEAEPSVGEALAVLTGLRDSLREHGLTATLDRQRSQLEPDEEETLRGEGSTAAAGLALHPLDAEGLDETIRTWERFHNIARGTGKDAEAQQPVGRARSESRLVTVESTIEYPIASVVLSKRACEVGPKVLGREITETAAAAAADLAERQDGYFTDLGLPIGPGEAAGMVEESKRLGEKGLEMVTAAREHQERITRLFYEGGHFA